MKAYQPPVHFKDGRYAPIKVLGTGTYGQVLLCEDTHTKVRVWPDTPTDAPSAQKQQQQRRFPAAAAHHHHQLHQSTGSPTTTATTTTTATAVYANKRVAVKVAQRDAAYRRSALNEIKALETLKRCEERDRASPTAPPTHHHHQQQQRRAGAVVADGGDDEEADNEDGGCDAAAAAAAAHFCSVEILDYFEEGGHVCIVTELLQRNIFEIIKERQFAPFSVCKVKHIAYNVIKALSALHTNGIMHCDIKPENIMLRECTTTATATTTVTATACGGKKPRSVRSRCAKPQLPQTQQTSTLVMESCTPSDSADFCTTNNGHHPHHHGRRGNIHYAGAGADTDDEYGEDVVAQHSSGNNRDDDDDDEEGGGGGGSGGGYNDDTYSLDRGPSGTSSSGCYDTATAITTTDTDSICGFDDNDDDDDSSDAASDVSSTESISSRFAYEPASVSVAPTAAGAAAAVASNALLSGQHVAHLQGRAATTTTTTTAAAAAAAQRDRMKYDFSRTVLIDYGAVREDHENAYFDVQSLWYRSPEVLCGLPYSHLIDAFSCGCFLFEIYTGKPLFAGKDVKDQLRRIVSLLGMPSEAALTRGKLVGQYGFLFQNAPPPPPLQHQQHQQQGMMMMMPVATVATSFVRSAPLDAIEGNFAKYLATCRGTGMERLGRYMGEQTARRQQRRQQQQQMQRGPHRGGGGTFDKGAAHHNSHPHPHPHQQHQHQQHQQHPVGPFAANIFDGSGSATNIANSSNTTSNSVNRGGTRSADGSFNAFSASTANKSNYANSSSNSVASPPVQAPSSLLLSSLSPPSTEVEADEEEGVRRCHRRREARRLLLADQERRDERLLVHLIFSLLQPDETRRISCTDALGHPFFATIREKGRAGPGAAVVTTANTTNTTNAACAVPATVGIPAPPPSMLTVARDGGGRRPRPRPRRRIVSSGEFYPTSSASPAGVIVTVGDNAGYPANSMNVPVMGTHMGTAMSGNSINSGGGSINGNPCHNGSINSVPHNCSIVSAGSAVGTPSNGVTPLLMFTNGGNTATASASSITTPSGAMAISNGSGGGSKWLASFSGPHSDYSPTSDFAGGGGSGTGPPTASGSLIVHNGGCGGGGGVVSVANSTNAHQNCFFVSSPLSASGGNALGSNSPLTHFPGTFAGVPVNQQAQALALVQQQQQQQYQQQQQQLRHQRQQQLQAAGYGSSPTAYFSPAQFQQQQQQQMSGGQFVYYAGQPTFGPGSNNSNSGGGGHPHPHPQQQQQQHHQQQQQQQQQMQMHRIVLSAALGHVPTVMAMP